MEIQEVALSKLRKTKLLKRRHSPDQLDRCVHSLVTYGQYSPLVVSGNEILCGTLVYDAMKRLKMRHAKIVQVGELSDEKKRELRYLDNRTFEMSFWKDDELKMFLMGQEGADPVTGKLYDCEDGFIQGGYLLPEMRRGRWRRVLFAPTGALLSPTSSFQGESIPGICHAVIISAGKEN